MSGGSANANRGKRFEREIVNLARTFGFRAIRSWGSDGRSIGLDKEVDVVIGDYKTDEHLKVQAKLRTPLPDYIKPNLEVVDVQMIKESKGKIFVVLEMNRFLSILKKAFPKWLQ